MLENLKGRYQQMLRTDILGVDLAFSVRSENLLVFVQKIAEELSVLNWRDMIAQDAETSAEHFEIFYIFTSMPHQLTLAVSVYHAKQECLPSLTELYPHAAYLEHEVNESQGVRFTRQYTPGLYRHPLMDVHRQMPNGFFANDGLVDIDHFLQVQHQRQIDDSIVNFAPGNPIFRNAPRMMARLSDQRIEALEVDVGHRHSGVEKAAVSMSCERLVHLGSLMGLGFADTLNGLMAMALERAAGLSITPKAEIIRVFVFELDRIADHLNQFILLAQHYHAHALLEQCLLARDLLASFSAKTVGKRVGGGAIRLGGTIDIFSQLSVYDFFSAVEGLIAAVDGIEKTFASKKSWKDLFDCPSISKQQVIDLNLLGPVLRASSVNWDYRKRYPYYLYGELRFEVPCGVEGSCYDRYLVCLAEIRQSLSILVQLLDSIPSGTATIPLARNLMIPSTVKHVFSCVEAPRGELGAFISFGRNSTIRHVKLMPSTRSTVFALPQLSAGLNLDQFSAFYLSLGINSTEVDR